jgi:hypothetical protein
MPAAFGDGSSKFGLFRCAFGDTFVVYLACCTSWLGVQIRIFVVVMDLLVGNWW